MHLKKLELVGFKSFANKTVLEFPKGITGIVGPNGSGKSNVIDALRWILGEGSAKNLRADKSENLIFSGTTIKPRASMAQVTATFDNASGFFPVDFNEVVISRRVKRDGASRYWINDSEVRLRDLVDLFSQARLGTKFSIINQGSSDLFITASPKERREMMEEILGLRQYQIKRRDSENKLASTKSNLEKVEALLDELLPRLRLLRRQSKKWERHEELNKELAKIEKRYFSSRIKQLRGNEKVIEPKQKDLEERMARAKKVLEEAKQNLKKVEDSQRGEDDFDKERAKQQELLDQKMELSSSVARLEAEIEFASKLEVKGVDKNKAVSVIRNVKEILNQISHLDFDGLKQKLISLKQDIDEALGEVKEKGVDDSILKKKDEVLNEIKKIDEEVSKINLSIKEGETSMKGFHKEFKKAFERLEQAKEDILKLESEENKIILEKERLEMHFDELKDQLDYIGRKIEDFEGGGEDLNENELSELERLMLKLRGELASIGDVDPSLISESKEVEERHEFLTKQSEDLKKAVADLEKLIADLKQKLHDEFESSLKKVNEEFNNYFQAMFNGGKAKLIMIKPEPVQNTEEGDGEDEQESKEDRNIGGLDISLAIPRKSIKGMDMLSGGERSLVSIAVLFALVSVSPPPFLVLDEVDAALDENNTKRFASLIHEFSENTQFMVVTHNRATMGEADVLYGVTMGEDGTSKVISLKLDKAEEMVS